MLSRLLRTGSTPTLVARAVTGLVFVSEGLQKFILPDLVGAGRFARIGFTHPEFWAAFTGYFEITCGTLLLIGLMTRLAAIPLLIIMATAFFTTKYPLLIEKGFWIFAHEYRTDFVMTLLLFFLLYYGGGKFSLDKRLDERTKK
jgi:putative oxidoreductase